MTESAGMVNVSLIDTFAACGLATGSTGAGGAASATAGGSGDGASTGGAGSVFLAGAGAACGAGAAAATRAVRDAVASEGLRSFTAFSTGSDEGTARGDREAGASASLGVSIVALSTGAGLVPSGEPDGMAGVGAGVAWAGRASTAGSSAVRWLWAT